MIKPMMFVGVPVAFAVGWLFAPAAVSAKPGGGAHFGHAPMHVAPFHRHRRSNRLIWIAPRYYDYGEPGYLPPAPPPSDEHVSEVRRGCEPQSYTVPSSNGGESQVTVIRC